ncbi:MAG: hypothetical protein ACXV8Q_03425 [Methylobacter sp.]
MTILAGDIKLLASDTMTDAAEGGGAMTGNVIINGQSNNIFDDISTMDRVYGAAHLRKIFGAVNTQTIDKYYGAHLILAKLPGDAKIGVNLFNSGDWFDRRATAKSRIEAYRAQGAVYNGFLWATQYTGSRALAIFQSESAPIPGIGAVLLLKSATAEQYVRIVNLDQVLQTFTDANGPFTRRILTIEISDVLTADFVGSEISRYDTLNPSGRIYQTVVANAARYYSARPLALSANLSDTVVKVDSVYSQVVPASQSEVALVDNTAGGSAVAVLDSATGTTSFSTSVAFSANSALYLGSPCLPGTLSIPVSGGTIVDDAGLLKIGVTAIGTINYAEGTLHFGDTSPTYSGSKTVTFHPAAAPSRLADTTALPVTAANRGYVWTINITPAPKPGSVKVMFRALGQWYELNDNGAGGLIGTESGIGSGTVNYSTGSVVATLAALPDVDSYVIFAWGSAADFINRSAITRGPFKFKKTLANSGLDASTLTITWNDGTARTITSNAAGTLSGYGTGTVNVGTGLLEFYPNTLPLPGQTFTIAYSYGTKQTATITSFNTVGNMVTMDIGDNIIPGSIEIAWVGDWTAAPAAYGSVQLPISAGSVNQMDVDNGSGALRGGRSSTINYATGVISFDATASVNYQEAVTTLSGTELLNDPGKFASLTTTEWVTKTATTTVPTSFTVHYRTAAAGQSASETFTPAAVELDLTPDGTGTIVQGSVLFTLGGRTYVDRSGLLYYAIDPATGAGTYGGTIDYTTGLVSLSSWASGQANSVSVKSLMATMNFTPVTHAVFRIAVAPVKPQSFQIRAVPAEGGGQITATADANGGIETTAIYGHVDYETGVVNVLFGQWVTAAGNESQPWYDATRIRADGKIFKPKPVFSDTILFNAVGYRYLPLSASILGLDPVRLPADGRVPVYAPGDVLVILNDQTTTGTYTSGSTTNLGRVRLAKLTVRDAGGNMLPVDKYTANLDTGVITWGSLTGVSQPLTIVDRIEDMAVCTDVQITGQLALSQPLTHAFPLNGTLVANAIIYGNLYAHTSIPFDQQTWTNVWSDALIGSSVSAQYNFSQYPIQVDNQSAIQERWLIKFSNGTTVDVIGEHVGQILTGAPISGAIAPVNPETGFPYFTIPAAGWGSGWAAGNCLRFNTNAANAPTWIIQAIGQGQATNTDYTFCLELRGDIDTP